MSDLGRGSENWKDTDLTHFTLGRVPYLSFILGYFGYTAAILFVHEELHMLQNFTASELNEIFLVQQPRQMVEWRVKKCYKEHLCPYHQENNYFRIHSADGFRKSSFTRHSSTSHGSDGC